MNERMSVVISFNQLAKLASQLPPADKRRLARKLEEEANREETAGAQTVGRVAVDARPAQDLEKRPAGFRGVKIGPGRKNADSSFE